VRATDGLGHDLVDDAELVEIGRRQPERFRSLDLAARIAPEDGGAALRRNHAVDRELMHQDAIADGDAERATAPSLSVYDDDDRHVESGHLAKVERNRLGNPAFFGFDARVSRRSVDERNHRAAEFLGKLHRPQRLPIALRPRVPEVPENLLLRIATSALVM